MIKSTTLFIALFFVLIDPGFSQAPKNVTQPTEWLAINASFNLGKRVGVVTDGNFRFVDKMASMQHMLRAGLEVQVVKGLSIVPFGYCYVWNFRYGEQPATFVNNEFRFWEQVQYKHKIGKWAVGHRLRIEQRSIQKHHYSNLTDETQVDDGFTNHQGRLRYRAYLTHPLTNADNGSKFLYLNIWDEVHFAWGNAVKSVQPNQNRVFVGIGYQIDKKTSIQTGMIYQLLKKDNGIQRENNIGGMVQLNMAFDCYKQTQK